jgi:ATP-dependent helicase HrpB
MSQLSVENIREQLREVLDKQNRCVLKAPPGSGKSTLVPQFILDDVITNNQSVIVLQPRRIAARMLATYICGLRNTELGNEVGYRVRLESRQGANTRILFVTEGILLNRLLSNDPLNEVGALVFDEFHERHLETDLSLALALQLQHKRPDLKLVVMSATLDAQNVLQYMGNCPLIETEGRAYTVDIRYKQAKPYETIWDFATQQLEIALTDVHEGSALVFMPGSFEIRKTIEAIRKRTSLQNFEVQPLYGSLTKDEQDRAMREEGRKIIVSTNVAETSLTIPNIRLVVDSGLARVSRFDSKRGFNTLYVQPISISSANQRAGRAGRTAEGVCIRLWSEFEHSSRVRFDAPEIHRVDLSEIILGLIAYGVQSPYLFPWLEKPTETAINNALELLVDLGALNSEGQITPLGRKMAQLNLHPRFGRMLARAAELNCIAPACIVAALAQSSGLLTNTRDEVLLQEQEYTFGNPDSDLLFELNAWLWAGNRQFHHAECARLGINANTARQVGHLALQLLHRVEPKRDNQKLPRENISNEEAQRLRECIFTGFIDFLAIRHRTNSATCQLMHGKSGQLHRDSIVRDARLMVATEIEETKSPTGIQLNLRKVTLVDEQWLENLINQGLEKKTTEYFDKEKKIAVCTTEHSLHGLIIKHETTPLTNNDKASVIITHAILNGEIKFEQWNDEVEHYIRRVNFSATNAPHYGIPPVDAEAKEFIIQQTVYKCKTEKEVQKCNVWPALKAWLSYEQQAAVEMLAPLSITLPRRKYPVKLRYDEKGDAILSETVQGLYDCPLPVTVAEGKVQVIFEILAPSRRPVQITRDLDYFWKNSYLDVKKELKGRYPKHEWR